MGFAGWLLFLALAVGILVHLATVHSFQILHASSGDHIKAIQKMLGQRIAAILLICGKLPFAVCATAGLVVSAGFVFNEVFAYWFPNFAFAFLLLATILLLNLFGRKAALVTQVITISAACIGLLILSGAGSFNLPESRSISETNVTFDYRYLVAAVIVLVGFDMALYAGKDDHISFSQLSRAMVIALVASGLLLGIWGLVTMAIVPTEKLQSSTIPYMIAARKAFGQTGRLIMGMVVILGVFAAVNSMIHSVSTMISQLASNNERISKRISSTKIRVATLLLVATASAFLMVMGFAGEPVLETWIRSSLVLWLIYYVAVTISAYLAGRRAQLSNEVGRTSSATLLKVLSIVGSALATVGLFLLEPKPIEMLVFIVVTTSVVTIIVTGSDFYFGRMANRISKNPLSHNRI